MEKGGCFRCEVGFSGPSPPIGGTSVNYISRTVRTVGFTVTIWTMTSTNMPVLNQAELVAATIKVA